MQRFIYSSEELSEYLTKKLWQRVFLVCGHSAEHLKVYKELKQAEIEITQFSDFTPNPKYEDVKRGVELFKCNSYDGIIAIGGGSAIDVAKCIKIYSSMNDQIEYIDQKICENNSILIVVPTTAGTGSESTKFSVIYYKGNKISVEHENCMPDVVLLDAENLNTLPEFQRKVTLLDAFCHSVESYWSVNSTIQSRIYSKKALRIIVDTWRGYIRNESIANESMLLAANIAGKAINIAKTTAGHAMSYKLTSKYGVAHGQAVAMCVRVLWKHLLQNVDTCDSREKEYVKGILNEIATAMGAYTAQQGYDIFTSMLDELGLTSIHAVDENEILYLADSVNEERLKNYPVKLKKNDIIKLYQEILA